MRFVGILRVAVFGFGILGAVGVVVAAAARWFHFRVASGTSVVSLRFACIASEVLVLFALRALPCVALVALRSFRVFSGAELTVIS